MRLFIAIPVPETLYEYCKKMQSQFEGLRKTKDFHLTLQFLGDGIEDADQIMQLLNQVEFRAFEIEMDGIVPFGPSHKPRGIWINCKEDEPLIKLADEIRNRMIPLGYESDKPFKAHITLGRYKIPPDVLPERLKGEVHRFEVKHFELIQSHLGDYMTLQTVHSMTD